MASLTLGLSGGLLGAEIGAPFAGIGGLTGAALGFAIGSVIGGTAGSIVDQAVVYPALFGRQNQYIGPRLADVHITTGSLGSPLSFCMGRQNRVGGTVIWVGPITQVDYNSSVGGKSGGEVTSSEYFVSIAVAFCEGPINAFRKVWADGLLIYDQSSNAGGGIDNKYKSINFYLGQQTQPTDPIIQAQQGSANTPSFVNTAYMVIELLHLRYWGNRLPNFNAMIEAQEQLLLSDAIANVWERAGRSTTDINTDWVQDIEVVGYEVPGPHTPTAILEPLMVAWDVVSQEQDGIVYFYHRKDMLSVSLDPTIFAAYEDGTGDPVRAIEITEKGDMDLPREVNVKYIDASMFWQPNAQRSWKNNCISPVNTQISLPLVIDGNDARAISQRVLWSQWAERWDMSFTLAPSVGVVLQESDLFNVTVDGFNYSGRISTVGRGQNWVNEIKGISEQQSLLTQVATADIPDINAEPEPQGDVLHNLVIMELPALPWKGFNPHSGVNFSVCRGQLGDRWIAGEVDTSLTNLLGSFTLWNNYAREGQMGVVTEALPIVTPSTSNDVLGTWSSKQTLTITVLNPNWTLQSESEFQTVENWANMVWIGPPGGQGEVIQYENVVNTAPNTFVISRLLRGRLGTEDIAEGQVHNPSEIAVLIPYSGTGPPPIFVETGEVGRTVYHKAIPNGTSAAGIGAIPTVASYRFARNIAPAMPAHVHAVRDVSNNLIITWIRRCPYSVPIFPASGGDVPQPFGSEKYEIEIYTGLGAVVRIISAPGNSSDGVPNSATYTAAQQTTDGFTPGNPITLQIFQINDGLPNNRGRGPGTGPTVY